MPKFDYSVEETSVVSAGASSYSIPDGWYVLKVTEMKDGVTPWGEQQIDVVWDVAQGPEADKCARNDWSEYSHTLHLRLTGSGAGLTKHWIHMVSDSNDGFRASKAFDTDDFDAFRGKVFGARLANEDSSKVNQRTGRPYRNTNIKEICAASDAAARTGTAQATTEAPADDVAEDDIPF